MHWGRDDGELPGYRDRRALEPYLLAQSHPPGSKIAVGSDAGEDRRCGLIEQCAQMRVASA